MTPIARGVLLALAAASAFGATTPLIQRLGAGSGPAAIAALLYLGAAGFAAIPHRREAEIRLRRRWWPRVVAVGLFGAFVAPIALAAGLARIHGTAAALLLNFEAVFTVALGALVYREPLGPRVSLAVLAIVTGGVLVAVDQGGTGAIGWSGPLLVVLATLAWAVDNALSRPLADLDPSDVVVGKGIVGAISSLVVAAAVGAAWPGVSQSVGLVACGAIGFGGSLRLYLRAQRVLGAARTGSVFAVAPFLGMLAAILLGQPLGGWLTALGGVAMGVGVWLHFGERHDHAHVHPPDVHTHPHRHDDSHHDDHRHEPPFEGEHTHEHAHRERQHAHPHGEDLHHRHPHS
jgi:drug/metabolite transporter (DMT)-like permease